MQDTNINDIMLEYLYGLKSDTITGKCVST